MAALAISKDDTVMVSGIGCSSRLPAYVDIVLGIEESKKSERVFYYQTRVFMPVAQETYEPFKEVELQVLNELGIGLGR